MAERKSTARWEGTLEEGKGTMRLGSGAWEGAYSFRSRFEEGTGSNPEELLAAAHAACFSMQIGASLGREGVSAESVETTAVAHLRQVDGKPTVARMDLRTEVTVPGGDEEQIRRVAQAAKEQCIVSRALAAIGEIELDLTVRT